MKTRNLIIASSCLFASAFANANVDLSQAISQKLSAKADAALSSMTVQLDVTLSNKMDELVQSNIQKVEATEKVAPTVAKVEKPTETLGKASEQDNNTVTYLGFFANLDKE